MDRNTVITQFKRANALFLKQHYQEARALYETIYALHPHDSALAYNYATCLLKLEEFDLAKKVYLQSLTDAKDDIDSLYNLGVIALTQQQLQQAETYFQDVLSYKDQHFAALINLGVSLIKQGRHQAAIPIYQRALTLQPNNPSIQYTLNALQGEQVPKRAPPAYIESIFDNYAAYYDQHLLHDLAYQFPTLLNSYLTQLTPQPAGNMLDLGCGTGLAGAVLKPYATHLTGVDLSQAMLKKAEANRIYDGLLQADIMDYLSTSPLRFDAILAAEVLIYFGQLDTLFKRIHRCLNPNAYVIFTTEIATANAYQLNVTGRYAHQVEYILDLVKQLHWQCKLSETIVNRQQAGFDVPCQLFVLQRIC